MRSKSQKNRSLKTTTGRDNNGSPRDQAAPVLERTTITLPSPDIASLYNFGFFNDLEVLTRMFIARGPTELPLTALAGASFARHDVTVTEMAIDTPRVLEPLTPRNDLLQLLFLLRNQSTLPFPAVHPELQSGLSISTIYPAVHGGMPQGGVPRTITDEANLIQLLQQRNAVASASMESRNRLLQRQLLERLLYTRREQQHVELLLPAEITTLLQAPTRRETSSNTNINTNAIPQSLPVCLSRPADVWKLTEYQRFLRQQIQVFAASFEDAGTHLRGRNKPVLVGQVGIRCRHCAPVPVRFRRRGSAYFPSQKYGIYQAAQNMATSHFPVCLELPASVLQELQQLRETSTAGAGRRYWVESATELGLVDTEDAGMRFRRDDRGTSREAAAVLRR